MSEMSLSEVRERQLIGAILADQRLASHVSEVDPMILSGDGMRTVLRTIQAIHASGGTPDLLSVAAKMEADGTLSEISGWPTLMRLADESPYVFHIPELIDGIRKDSVRRSIKVESISLSLLADDPTTDVETLLKRMDATRERLESRGRKEVKTWSSKELSEADFRNEYLVNGVLARDQFTIIGGPSKGCKTTLLIDLALSLGSGAKFLNQFVVPKAVRVAVVSGESGEKTIRETAVRIARSKPWWNLEDYENVLWRFDIPKLDDPQTIAGLIRYVREMRLDVLILDPFYLMAGLGSDQAGNMFQVGKLLAGLQRVGNETGVTVGIAHHFKKLGFVEQFSVPELGFLAWSGFEQYTRQWLLVNRRESFDAETGLHKLWFSCGGSAGHGGLYAVNALEGRLTDQGGRRWEVTVTKASEARQEAAKEKERQKIDKRRGQGAVYLELIKKELKKHPDGMTRSNLRENTGINGTKLTTFLAELSEAGETVPAQVLGKNGQTYSGIKLATRTPGQPPGQTVRVDCPSDTSTSVGQLPPYRGSVRPTGGFPMENQQDEEEQVVRVDDLTESDHANIDRLFPVGGKP